MDSSSVPFGVETSIGRRVSWKSRLLHSRYIIFCFFLFKTDVKIIYLGSANGLLFRSGENKFRKMKKLMKMPRDHHIMKLLMFVNAIKWLERQQNSIPIQIKYLRRICDIAALKIMTSLMCRSL